MEFLNCEQSTTFDKILEIIEDLEYENLCNLLEIAELKVKIKHLEEK